MLLLERARILTSEWADKIWEGAPLPRKRLLVWDLVKCHCTQKMKTQLHQSNSLVVYVPPGCTKVIQPASVSWNAQFKVAYRDLLVSGWLKGNTSWKHEGSSQTIDGTMGGVSAWEAITKETIVRSFEVVWG